MKDTLRVVRYFSKIEYIEDLLKNKRLYAARPSTFNDPFDSFIRSPSDILEKDDIGIIKTYGDLTDFCKSHSHLNEVQMLKACCPRITSIERSQQIDSHILSKALRESNISPETVKNTSDNVYRVICFSRPSQNTKEQEEEVLLWSHYAGNHTGARVFFNIPKDSARYFFGQMEYRDKPYYWDGEEKNLLKCLTQKGNVWKYEHEVRMFIPTHSQSAIINCGDRDYFPIDLNMIKQIDFGFLCPDEKKQQVIKLLKDLPGADIRLRNMTPRDNTFILDNDLQQN